MSRLLWTSLVLYLTGLPGVAAELTYKERLIPVLAKQIPGILDVFDPKTGQFGKGIWISTDQNRMYPLAVAYAWQSDQNPYYKDNRILDVIMKAGDALIEDADDKGQWVFRKKDGSTWGKIWMPWTYSRWVRAFSLIKDDMPQDRREKWEKALTLGYSGIRRNELDHVHNIPAHHAMGLYVAGEALDRKDWQKQAAEFLIKVADKQAEGGYWSENVGPVVGYNFVYVDALGTYYALSGDSRVLPVLRKAARFHLHFTYPNGHRVETVDERNPYHERVDTGNVGFTFTPEGRAYLANQWSIYGFEKLPADLIASLLLYGEEGPTAGEDTSEKEKTFVLTENGRRCAATIQKGPWFICLSAYTAAIPRSRWIQDRQNFVSIFHEKTGLILGGGNTKLQPAWSNFTVGDMALLQHTPGDTDPDFMPKGELYHVPSMAELIGDPVSGIKLVYGPQRCEINIDILNDNLLEYTVKSTTASDLPVAAHLTLIPHLDDELWTDGGQETNFEDRSLQLSAEKLGGMIRHAGYRLDLPPVASLHWPALPHNPYRKDGRATPEEGRIEIRIPLTQAEPAHTITLQVTGSDS